MANYKYQAMTKEGKTVVGNIDAQDENDAKTRIQQMQMNPLRIVNSGVGEHTRTTTTATATGTLTKTNSAQKKSGKAVKANDSLLENLFAARVKPKDLQVFTRQFATLINAGITVVDALKILGGGASIPIVRAATNKARTSLEAGRTLADSLAASPYVFDRFYCNMVRAGEASGALETILNRMAIYLEKAEKIKNQVKGALFYPAAITAVGTLVISAILIFVIPKFQELYANSNQEPPALTQMVVAISHALATKWYIFLSAIILIPMLMMAYYRTSDGRKMFDEFFISAPGFGPMVLKSGIARFSRTMSTLLGAGIPLIDAIEVAARTSGNYVIERTLLRSKESVTLGKSFSAPLAKEKLIPAMVTQMIAIGEQTGSMENMLAKIADFYEDEVENAVKGLTSLIEPILMVILGGIIAFLVLAMYLPVFNLASVTGGG